mgnify:CR=1 FL=1
MMGIWSLHLEQGTAPLNRCAFASILYFTEQGLEFHEPLKQSTLN